MTQRAAPADSLIRISTDETDLVLKISPAGRLYQVYLGEKLRHFEDARRLNWQVRTGSDGSYPVRGFEAYAAGGTEDFFEPALGVTHADGNKTTYLYYQNHRQQPIDGGTETLITLRDDRYPLQVVLHYAAYPKENVIKAWSEITHTESQPIVLNRMGSAMLYFDDTRYFLTNYHGDWAKEAQPATQQLQFGKKVIDTHLGTRAAMQSQPFFELGFDAEPRENEGRVLLGTMAWTGNFRCTFEIDNTGVLRLLPGINPYASAYTLAPDSVFVTPQFIFSLSRSGVGTASRHLQDWARRYQLKDGMGDRFTLLNNWENTGFDFNGKKLATLMREAKQLGVDLFLLDDGWFANKYPRNDDRAGLGDWAVNRQKLPEGIAGLTRDAKKAGVKFGIWIEPEMINPKSELFERHPDWVIRQPNRETYYYRHQLVLDLANPAVQDHVFGVVDSILTHHPEVAYFKWDCNSPITNVYSPSLGERQGNLYVDYVRGLYKVLQRIAKKYPRVPMMLCSGGGARCDYEALRYFTEFWCSDDTDPYERIYIQWSLSKFFPLKAMASHVTDWNKKTDLKFRIDVASMGKLGFDMDLSQLSEADWRFCREAVARYRELKPVIFDGDVYRLLSPYESQHAAVNVVDKARNRAVLFTYNLHPRYAENLRPVRLQGLDPDRQYLVEEINLRSGTRHAFGRLSDEGGAPSAPGRRGHQPGVPPHRPLRLIPHARPAVERRFFDVCDRCVRRRWASFLPTPRNRRQLPPRCGGDGRNKRLDSHGVQPFCLRVSRCCCRRQGWIATAVSFLSSAPLTSCRLRRRPVLCFSARTGTRSAKRGGRCPTSSLLRVSTRQTCSVSCTPAMV